MTSQGQGIIYGTNIQSEDILASLERFVLEFEVLEGDSHFHKKYLNDLKNLANEEGSTVLEVEAMHIKQFDREMYFQFIYFPVEMISFFDHLAKQMYARMFVEPETDPAELLRRQQKRDRLMVSIVGLEKVSVLRELTTREVNRLISFRGIVIRCSDLYPEMRSALFACGQCRHEARVLLEDARVE